MKRTPIISLLLILAGSSMTTASEIVVPTRSPGAVHLTAVPDMIIECADCGHRFTL